MPVTSEAKNRPANPALLADLSPVEPTESGPETERTAETERTPETERTAETERTPETQREAAKIPPLDITGVRTVAVGACLWLVGLVALLPFYSTLQDQGNGWWLWTCVAGFVFGLFGLEYCRRRRRRLAGQPEREVETSPLGAAGL